MQNILKKQNLKNKLIDEKELKDERALPSSLARTILDSRLISEPKKDIYNIKLVYCGNYLQVYHFDKFHILKKENDIDLRLNKLIDENLVSKNEKLLKDSNSIDKKNIIRSKLKCQRLAKCNADKWCSFITLTIAKNINDINIANKYLKIFKKSVKRVFPNFMCIGVPEFQKRGAVHYHLLTNIDIDNDLIFKQKNNEKFLHIKYWNYGFTKVDIVKGDIKKIIGYISKYMTKDVDDRLFSHHRYFYTKNLLMPKESYLNLNNKKHLAFLKKILNDKSIIYKNDYINPYNNEKIAFEEFLTTS